MAEADLDVVIRQLAKSQTKSLTVAVKKRRDAFLALAAKTADKDKKARFKQLAKDAMLYGTAAARRLQTSADKAGAAAQWACRSRPRIRHSPPPWRQSSPPEPVPHRCRPRRRA